MFRPAKLPRHIVRPLTAGEIALARLLFGDAIDYAQVRVHNARYLPLVQPKDVCMTPNGQLYFHPTRFRADFSCACETERHWFMHEMAHVWQHQMGFPVRLRGALRIGLSYEYELEAGGALGDYNMEAQAELLADYFMLKFVRHEDTGVYDDIMAAFVENPAAVCHLPRKW